MRLTNGLLNERSVWATLRPPHVRSSLYLSRHSNASAAHFSTDTAYLNPVRTTAVIVTSTSCSCYDRIPSVVYPFSLCLPFLYWQRWPSLLHIHIQHSGLIFFTYIPACWETGVRAEGEACCGVPEAERIKGLVPGPSIGSLAVLGCERVTFWSITQNRNRWTSANKPPLPLYTIIVCSNDGNPTIRRLPEQQRFPFESVSFSCGLGECFHAALAPLACRWRTCTYSTVNSFSSHISRLVWELGSALRVRHDTVCLKQRGLKSPTAAPRILLKKK